ncbi:MAG: ATPase domain-containing protein [Candidatus Jordarchaeum sp.]|uniref:ATPase domain-containing protein n=1 Tax=Candidatus Jordarchaeum sp. TaxID=2823881 RepID=UPI004049B683
MELVGSGIHDLDLLLSGGFIRDSPVLLLTETGTMGELLPLQIINHRMKEGDYGFVFDLDFPPIRIRDWFKSFNWNLESYEKDGHLFIVDGFTNLYGRLPTEEKYVIENPRDIVYLDSYLHDMKPLIENYKNKLFCVLYLSNTFLTKGQHLDKIVNLIYKNRITLSQYGLSVFVFDKGMMDNKMLSTLEHAFDYVIELKIVEQENSFQKYLRVTKSPLINYISDMVPYEVTLNGIGLRTEIIQEFEGMKHNAKMLQSGNIDFMGIRMTFIPADIFNLFSKIMIEKSDYETGYQLTHQLGKEIAYPITKNLLNKFKIANLEEAILFCARTCTLMGFGEMIIQDYNLEKGILKIRLDNSPICTQLNSGKKMGAFLEGAIEGAAEFYTGLKCNCEEVKCASKGDKYCEYKLTFLQEKLKTQETKT